MTHRLRYFLGEEAFHTKHDIAMRVRGILWGCDVPARLSPDDERLMLDLLVRHPRAADKIGAGITAVHLRPNPVYPNQRTFYVERIDGSIEDFSYLQCLHPSTPLQDIAEAMRQAIVPQILEYKTRLFGDKATIGCPVTEQRCTWEEVHVDHRPPLTFAELVKGFLLSKGFVPQDIELAEPPNGIGSIIADGSLSLEWQAYHATLADLWAISIEAHVALTKQRLQPKKASQDARSIPMTVTATDSPLNAQPSFTACATCGALVLTRVWVSATKHSPGTWRTLPEPVTPGLGVPHSCKKEVTP